MNPDIPVSPASAARPTPSCLKDAFPFRVGVALPTRMFTGEDKARTDLVLRQFNAITPENLLKPAHVHPEEGRFEFDVPDRYVKFGEKHRMKIIGHTLVWYQQTPDWFFVGPDYIEPAFRFAELFGVFRKYAEHFDRVTFWCIDDGTSWLNKSPIKGRTDYPLLFDRDLQPKKAFYRVLEEKP